ncbi:MAG: UDP-4-amino-4,6-dideoxy-N-acetyl-beta-L-altrosamine transaminase [Armatimonadetes bacterium]|nr:UDP-4-amino-4,6-dideoxy-N-acetyl-beta-L-altrosamine transaminase [Armatimonadota bacterium]
MDQSGSGVQSLGTAELPAIEGGTPVRSTFLPYARQWVGEKEVEKVTQVLRSDWITQGPVTREFEKEFARKVGARFAVSVNSGTSALHVALAAIGIGSPDEVITSPFTFAATSNAVLYLNGVPKFADIDPKTYNLDPDKAEARLSPNTRVILPVHFAGQPCNMDRLVAFSCKHRLFLLEDAAHALGATYRGKKIGSIGSVTIFSFHPVKHITTGEGGMVVTNNEAVAERAYMIRTHGIDKDAGKRFGKEGNWFYQMVALGYRFNMSEMQAALGLCQLEKLDDFLERRREIAGQYQSAFRDMPEVVTPHVEADSEHAWHLYTLQIRREALRVGRDRIIEALKAENIGANVHYIPVHLHPYYRENLDTKEGDYPIAEGLYRKILTLPLFPRMTDKDVEDVILAVKKVIGHYRK